MLAPVRSSNVSRTSSSAVTPLTPKQVTAYQEMTRAIEGYASTNVNFQPLGSQLQADSRRFDDSAFNPKNPKGPLGLSPESRQELDAVRASVNDALATSRFGDRELRPGEVIALQKVKFNLDRLASFDSSLRG